MTEHPIPPLYDGNSRILILGSFPSVRSREERFFYGHPQNRFWKVISSVLGEPTPTDVESKRELLLRHGIALWDVIASCDIMVIVSRNSMISRYFDTISLILCQIFYKNLD